MIEKVVAKPQDTFLEKEKLLSLLSTGKIEEIKATSLCDCNSMPCVAPPCNAYKPEETYGTD